jgi:hypothetical protein
MAIVMAVGVSCSKELSGTSSTTGAGTTTTSTSSTIAVAVDSSGTDSVYIIQPCSPGYFRDSITSSTLPSAIVSYLDSNYTGYLFQSAFAVKDSSGTVGGYVVIITYHDKPVGLLFDANGNFKQVLEQREGGDLEGDGWHHGGRFGNRDKSHDDTLALSALPSSVVSYINSNYPGDTLVKAYLDRDSSIVVISRDNGLFANIFSSSGEFVTRISLTPPVVIIQNVSQDSLPSADLSYLTTTYPNYVFENAVSVLQNDQLAGYIVVIDANNTKYGIWFDENGNVVATKTIW